MSANHQSTRSSELPSGWRRVAIKDMAESIQYGHTASAVERKDGPRFLRITDIQDGCVNWDTVPSCNIPKEDIPKYQLSSGDLVFARTGATTGKSFLIGECPEAVFASYLIRVRVSGGVDSRYLSAFFQSPEYWQQIEDGKRGIGQPNVNGTVLGQVQFPVAPIPEQRRIVAEIEKQFTRLDAGVAALRRVEANLKRYRATVLKAACEGRLVPKEAELARTGSGDPNFEKGDALLARIIDERHRNWRGRGKYKEPATPNTQNLPKLPDGWTWATADQLTSVITDGEHITPERSGSGVLLLSARNVLDGRISLEDVDFVPQHEYERIAKRLVVAPGDVLLSCSGSVGRSAVVPEGLLFTLVRSVAVLKPMLGMGSYLSLALRSPLLKQQISEKQTQTAQANIFQGKIKILCVPLPPIAEQARIVAEVDRRLSVIAELEATISLNLRLAIRLRQSVLEQAFTGKLFRSRETQT